ncbi:hypothetical protein OHW66_01970 [Acinetobacter baumannii]|nr:hypothetical protein [Acinetobacter baumannii]
MMFDLNKEREAFLNTFQYYKGRRDIIFSHEHELFMTRSNNPSEIAQKEISNMNSRWDAWLRSAKHHDAELKKAKAKVVSESSYGVILTCEQLRQALEFGAPDLKIESNVFSDEQMSTELAIIYQDHGHSGEGFYSYHVEYPDEGSIKLGESESGAANE